MKTPPFPTYHLYNPLQLLTESVKDAVTGCKKDACMLFWVFSPMRWKGTPKICDVDSSKKQKNSTNSHSLHFCHNSEGSWVLHLLPWRLKTGYKSLLSLSHSTLSHKLLKSMFWKGWELPRRWLAICSWEQSEFSSYSFIVLAFDALHRIQHSLGVQAWSLKST